jgi:hypothetical protein
LKLWLLILSSALKVNANYTFTQVEEPLSRLIPKHKGNISLDYQATPSFFNINYQFVDKRKMLSLMAERLPPQPSFRLLSVGQCNG